MSRPYDPARDIAEHLDAEAVALDSLVFIAEGGERRLGVPNARDRDLAERLMRDRALWQYRDASTLATVLAAVREGSTIEGPRSIVEATVTASGEVWRREPAMRTRVREDVRRRWALELEQHGARPIGWPAVEVTFMRYRSLVDLAVDSPGPYETADEATADLVHVRLRGEAVPA